jgi:hypothetical protein
MAITRRQFLARTAAAAAWTAAAGAAQLAGATPALASSSCTLGVWATNLGTLENKLGYTFRGIRYNQAMQCPIPTPRELRWVDEGRWFIYRNINAQTNNSRGTMVCRSWQSIANGIYDSYFIAGARALKNNQRFTAKRPYLLSFHHEQVVKNGHQCGNSTCGNAAQFIAAYRHVRNLFDKHGATVRTGGNVKFVWTPTASQFRMPDGPFGAPKVDPGPNFYDYVGVDGYNRLAHGTLLFRNPSEMLGAAHDYAVMRGKRLLVAEYGVQDGSTIASHVAKENFMLATASEIKSWGASGPGSAVGWLFSSTDGNRLDSSPASIHAMHLILQMPFFA